MESELFRFRADTVRQKQRDWSRRMPPRMEIQMAL